VGSGPSRPVPYAGMPVQVVHFGVTEDGVVEAVQDEGRTVVVAGQPFTLRPLNGHFVREGERHYGTRLSLRGA
jgi:hypothetical protein